MKNTNRYIALALCFTLTLGAFAYRPSEAKAIAGVDDAVVIGALLSAFAGGCGLIFSNNGMTSGQIADGMVDKWNEYKAAVLDLDSTFAGWLGYEDMDALLQAIVLSGGNALTVPRLVARKFADFTTWLVDNLGVTAGGASVPVVSRSVLDNVLSGFYSWASSHSDPKWAMAVYDDAVSKKYLAAVYNPNGVFRGSVLYTYALYSSDVTDIAFVIDDATSKLCLAEGNSVSVTYFNDGFFKRAGSGFASGRIPLFDYSQSVVTSEYGTDLSLFAPSYYKNPTIDLPVEGEEAANPTLSGVGDGTATAIEDLLQQILAQLQANTLAPTLDLAGTETGGNTGTDEDAKPYLPYIPQIFEKIKELPGTLANIWESIKGIPAAIAEKIGAFFTTLWGWLQNIIDAITALPAAIAEKIKALFVPREGYAAEFVADITATYQGRMGLLTYPFTVLADFVGTVATLEEQDPVLRWDAVEWQNKTIIAAGEYNLKSAVSSAQMQTVYMIYKTVVSGMLVVAFLHLCYKKLKEVQRN